MCLYTVQPRRATSLQGIAVSVLEANAGDSERRVGPQGLALSFCAFLIGPRDCRNVPSHCLLQLLLWSRVSACPGRIGEGFST